MKIFILGARRTAIGSFLGAFKDVPAVDLGVAAAAPLLDGVQGSDIADVIVGNVLQAGQGMNPARQIALRSGLPQAVPGQTVNRVCGSGMQAVVSAMQGIAAGDGRLYLAGGVENMSRAPFLSLDMRAGRKMGDSTLLDSLTKDGLTDPTHSCHMGITAENIAERWGITREEQDAFALESHRRATAANQEKTFADEIVAVDVPGRKGPVRVEVDESVRPDSSMEALAKLKPAFKKDGGHGDRGQFEWVERRCGDADDRERGVCVGARTVPRGGNCELCSHRRRSGFHGDGARGSCADCAEACWTADRGH